jgi:hypothetical protein
VVPLFSLAIAVGLIAGWMSGGSMARLGSAPVKVLWLFPAAFVAQVLMVRTLGGGDVPGWVLPVHLGVLVVVLGGLFALRRVPGAVVMALGLAMNASAIALNGGLMPQAPETLHINHAAEAPQAGRHLARTKGIVLPRGETRLWWLSDVVVFPPEIPIRGVFSVGDLAIAAGLAWSVHGLMQTRREGTTPTAVTAVTTEAAREQQTVEVLG